VDHTLLVGVVEGVGDVGDELGRLARRGAAGGEQVGEGDAFDEVADEVGRSFPHPRPLSRSTGRGGQHTHFVHGHDGGVAELGDAAGLAEEAVEVLRLVADVAAARDLDGDGAVELRIAGLEDRAETAVADFLDDLEAADGLAARRPGGGRDIFEAEAGAAGGARDLRARLDLDQLNRVLAMRTVEVNVHRAASEAETLPSLPAAYRSCYSKVDPAVW
jgi:hypothetical protein